MAEFGGAASLGRSPPLSWRGAWKEERKVFPSLIAVAPTPRDTLASTDEFPPLKVSDGPSMASGWIIPLAMQSHVKTKLIVHLVDGTYELFRHFYGLRRFNKGVDRPYGAVVGVLQTVLQMIEGGDTYLGVATDHVIESFRNRLWAGYKTGAGIEPHCSRSFIRSRRRSRRWAWSCGR